MRGPDAATLKRLTAAEKWLRRCNGYPAEGIQESRQTLLVVLGISADVCVDKQGRITWRGAGPMSLSENRFTAEPVTAEVPTMNTDRQGQAP